ncbi:MAG: hypothetical protein DRQ45_00590 [Gammaproteobacteria bacterium]|nr:MAG: hypothetical protein DRQ45_00590 [Gammaproteobacteria bacterium]
MPNESIKIDISLEQQSLQSFEKFNLLVDQAEKNTKELKLATIALNNARAKGGRGSYAQINRVNKATQKSIALTTDLVNEKTRLEAVNQRLNATNKKSIPIMQRMQRSWFKLIATWQIAVGLFRQIAKIKDTLVTLDSFRFAMTKITGSVQEAADAFKFVTVLSDKYGVSLQATADRYVKFSTAARQAGLSLKETQAIYSSFSKASGVLGLKTDEVRGVFLALEQMLSKGKVTTEELRRQLGERLPGAFGFAVEAYNRLNEGQEVTIDQFDALLKKGKVLSHELIPELARVVEEKLGIQMVDSVDTLQASIVRADNAFVIMVEDMENGTGAMAETFKAFYNVMADIWKDIGELFLTDAEIDQKYYDRGFAQGKLYLAGVENSAKDKSGEVNQTVVAQALADAWQTALKGYNQASFDELTKENLINVGAWTKAMDLAFTDPEGRMAHYKEELGKVAGAMANLGVVVEDFKRKTGDDGDKKRPKVLGIPIPDEAVTSGLIEQLESLVDFYERLAKAAPTEEAIQAYTRLALGAKSQLVALRQLDQSTFDPEGKGLPKGTIGGGKTTTTKEDIQYWVGDNREIIAASQDLANELFGIGNALFNRKLEDINAEIVATELLYDRKLELADQDSEQYKDIQRERAKELDKLHAKELEIRQQQAKFQKAQAITNAVINTAVAVTEVLAIPVLAALVAAAGAAQIAMIAATPIPQYAKGRLGGREELAIVGDGGVQEVIQGKNGAYLTPNKPTLALLKKGDSVYKDKDSYRNEVMRSIVGDITNTYESKMIEEAISKGFKKAKINNYLKMPKIEVSLDHTLWLNKNSQF